jgi:hypothetical protein
MVCSDKCFDRRKKRYRRRDLTKKTRRRRLYAERKAAYLAFQELVESGVTGLIESVTKAK